MRSAVASSFPTSRSWWRIGRAKKPQRVWPRACTSRARTRSRTVDSPLAVVGQAVERRQQGGAALERLAELLGVDAPGAADALDRRRLAGLADGVRVDRHGGPRRAGDAQRAQPPLVADPARLVGRDDGRVGRVHPLREVPEALPPDPRRDRDLPAQRQDLEHLGHVAVVGPARRRPRDGARVRDVARQQRPGLAEPLEDVPPEPIVRRARSRAFSQVGRPAMSARKRRRSPIGGRGVELEQRPILLQGLLQVSRRYADPTDSRLQGPR